MNHQFRVNEIVKMKDGDDWIFGQVTIPKPDRTKVLWDDYRFDYDYYPNEDLFPLSDEELESRGWKK